MFDKSAGRTLRDMSWRDTRDTSWRDTKTTSWREIYDDSVHSGGCDEVLRSLLIKSFSDIFTLCVQISCFLKRPNERCNVQITQTVQIVETAGEGLKKSSHGRLNYSRQHTLSEVPLNSLLFISIRQISFSEELGKVAKAAYLRCGKLLIEK